MKTLFAHRGMSSLAPENTLAAFSLAPQYGLDWIECDVDILADGTIVVSHDDTLDRCTDRPGSLYDLTREDLQDIDAGSWFADEFIGEPLPTFADLIALVNTLEINVNVEIKSCTAGWEMSEKLIDGVLSELKNLNKTSDLLVSCFNPLVLAEFKRRSPHTNVACLFSREMLLEGDWLSVLQACKADAINVDNEGLTKEQVIEMKSHGYAVNVYTVNHLGRANQLFNWGVDGVFTDVGQNFPSRYRHLNQEK
ncbi:glycerophosphoryl diester phosphodiesterase [Enterovibrio norvegicus]|uniref:Glycerophosphoryl diester phosphodiesterase n=1 Tax=Enterovibrio norvegicus DSM 15893 TaxID=1121869 RepID=A0A1I5JWI9_9GAMM|nr:glycerophosphodiester phosphodiesterase family protein [Enterovibrio norvegicus]MCC4797300.1 glycerophosphoryl diester phosphodiesterase [Enterovibrio norvegicus]OEF64439.1 glycerophosphoryl diester phosphodiesterase [Enterovibrio norvegicus]PMH72288.1 glycerophosphoryl diester phosphodiesterase [Enterovibrio norvegicus]PMI27025.1 glycerophosphoryl diester phosphodiesterase [Enterovibrio norvegicus]PMI40144.1 glycerophosphoryl diester phosphodiesterase [Enterovibrio norvegicus]